MSHVCLNELTTLYMSMLRIRLVEEAIANRYSAQKMRCPVHLSIGQEAAAVAVCAQLEKSDYAVSTHRAHAHYLAKGGCLKAMIAEIYGKSTGCTRGRGGSMHLIDLEVGFLGSTPIVGGSIPIGVGAAFGAFLKGEPKVTVVFLGEGATEEGVFAESMNFAALHKLPVLFACENNLYSVYSPMDVRQPEERNRVKIAEAHGLYALDGDGNCIEKATRLAKEAVDYVRFGKGPCYLELATYRHREHCGPQIDPFRPSEEVEIWMKRDPLLNCPDEVIQKKEKILQEIEEAFVFAETSSFPTYDLKSETPYAQKYHLC